jgi:steroid delta-isomerase-like uncharacterized protein
MPETQKMVDELFGAWNAHDLERVSILYAPHYLGMDVSQSKPHEGREGIKETISAYLHAFPDFHIQPEEIIEQGNRLVVVWNATGTHEGKLMNIPATGVHITVRGVTILTTEDNLVTNALYLWDVAAVLREIGLLPEL